MAGTTFHDLKPLYVGFSDMPLVSISNSQRKPIANAESSPQRSTTAFRSRRSKTDFPTRYVAKWWRSSAASRRRSGPIGQSAIAQALGIRIKIAAKVDKVDEAYFRESIEPLFNLPGVEYIGEIDERSKSEFLGKASHCCFRSTGRSRSDCR